jgi:hypothetical protein
MDDNEFYASCNKNKRIKELEKEIEELKKDKDGYSDDTGLMFQTAYKISIRLMEERQKHIRTKLEKAKLEKENEDLMICLEKQKVISKYLREWKKRQKESRRRWLKIYVELKTKVEELKNENENLREWKRNHIVSNRLT